MLCGVIRPAGLQTCEQMLVILEAGGGWGAECVVMSKQKGFFTLTKLECTLVRCAVPKCVFVFSGGKKLSYSWKTIGNLTVVVATVEPPHYK